MDKPPLIPEYITRYQVSHGIVRRRLLIVPPTPLIYINCYDETEALKMAELYATCHGEKVALDALRYWYYSMMYKH